jgi:hypothetical protein
MLLSGSAAFGAVAGWWLLLVPWRRGRLALAATVPIAVAATAWLLGGGTTLPAVVAGLVVGAAAHLVFRLMIRRSSFRRGG